MNIVNTVYPYIFPAAILLILSIEWFRFGRDPRKRKNFSIRYAAAKGITPAEAGTLIDELADFQDVMATLIDLAIRKHFIIEDLGDDFRLQLLQNYEEDPGLEKHEIALLKSLFGRKEAVKISEIKANFKHDLPYIKEELYEAVKRKGFFETNPRKARGKLMSYGLIFAFLTFLIPLGLAYLQYLGKILEVPTWHFFFALLITTFLFFLFSVFMPKKTSKGHAIYEQLLGLELFLQHPHDKPQGYAEERITFEKLLPYAIIFETLELWIEVHTTLYEHELPAFWKRQNDKSPFSLPQLAERLKFIQELLR